MVSHKGIRRDVPIPYYFQLLQLLRDEIENGTWPGHTAIKSEHDLCATYGVSRTVVRQALGDVLWRTDAGIHLADHRTPPDWVDDLAVRFSSGARWDIQATARCDWGTKFRKTTAQWVRAARSGRLLWQQLEMPYEAACARVTIGAIARAATEAARLRFRPILMTSFAFILGVVPLLTAKGAGASARASLGLSVFSGMIASTCLAVLFAPSLFVVVQGIEERLAPRKKPAVLQGAPGE